MNFNPSLKHAVIGASNNPEKFGFKILTHLKSLGVNVIPVNPNETEILGIPCSPSIEVLSPDTVLVFVVPPTVSMRIVTDAISRGFKLFWFQPGSFDDDVLTLCSTAGVDFSAGMCMLHQ